MFVKEMLSVKDLVIFGGYFIRVFISGMSECSRRESGF